MIFNMKKTILFALCAVFAIGVFAQHDSGRRARFSPEKYKRHFEEYVVKKACLTEAEASAFFPLFHEMRDKQRTMAREINKLSRDSKNAQADSDYERIVERMSNLEVEQKELDRLYNKKFHAVLSWKKIFMVRRAAHEFNMEALKKFYPSRKRHSNPQQ